MSALVPCRCGREGCDRMSCPVCDCSECKWPGACYGRCEWCGEPTKVMTVLDGTETIERDDGLGPWMDITCSPECGVASWEDANARGLVISVGDVTPERMNELLTGGGMQLDGVGKVVPS